MPSTYNTVSVATTATQILSPDATRRGWVIYNAGANAVYYGPDDSITTANTVALQPKSTILSSDVVNYKGSIYGIVSAGTEDVRYWEWGT